MMSKDPLQIAIGEIGVTESPSGSNRTKYGKWYGLDGQPWCMMFVQWCFDQAGYKLPHRSASCSELLNWYKKYQPEAVHEWPEPRDIVIYNFGHTGIVEKVNYATITAIEGNTSPGSAGSQDNGGGVYRRERSIPLAKAYIRPFTNYTFEEDNNMNARERDIMNEAFKDALNKYHEEQLKERRDNDCGSWSREAREYAISSGLFVGSGTTPDGQPNYMWEDFVTREQVAQLFYRFAQRNGLV